MIAMKEESATGSTFLPEPLEAPSSVSSLVPGDGIIKKDESSDVHAQAAAFPKTKPKRSEMGPKPDRKSDT